MTFRNFYNMQNFQNNLCNVCIIYLYLQEFDYKIVLLLKNYTVTFGLHLNLVIALMHCLLWLVQCRWTHSTAAVLDTYLFYISYLSALHQTSVVAVYNAHVS